MDYWLWRFAQIASQQLLGEGVDVTTLDNDVEKIENAKRFGFRVFYGDGTRYDVLRAAGAERVRIVCICTKNRETTNKLLIYYARPFLQLKFMRARMIVFTRLSFLIKAWITKYVKLMKVPFALAIKRLSV